MKRFLLLVFLMFKHLLPIDAQEPMWEEQSDFVNGFARVYHLDKVSFIDQKQKLISDFIFEDGRNFHNHLVAAKFNDKWGFISEHAQTVVPFDYDIVFDFCDTVSVVSRSGEWWLINMNGFLTKKLDITLCYGFKNGKAIVYKNNLKGLMNTDGDITYENPVADLIRKPASNWRPSVAKDCPDNLDFEFGNFTNWQCYVGYVDSVGNTNVVTVTPSAPTANRHTIITRANPSAIDPFGLFPTNPPDGSLKAVKLGNTQTGAQAERIRYTFHVSPTDSNFSFRYHYAVVLQDPGHTSWTQPRFTVKLIDSATNKYIDCASFEYVASSNLPGFLYSDVDSSVIYKDWSPVFISLRGYAGKTVYLEFTTADCVRRKHWAYAYVDVEDLCGQSVQVNYQCNTPQTTTLTGPPGFQYYNWWDQGFKNFLGTGETLILNPRPSKSALYFLQVIPYPNFGCTDTIPVRVFGGSNALFKSSDTVGICSPHSFTFYNQNTNSSGAAWDFGDGSSGNGDTISHIFNLPGNYNVTLSGTDSAGCTSTFQDSVKVIQPTASFTYSGGNFCNAHSVQYTATSSNIDSLFWNFGDGTFLNTTQKNVTHNYSQSGIYFPVLIAKSNYGCQIVLQGTDSIKIENLVPRFTYSIQNFCSNTNVVFKDSSNSFFGIASGIWSFGDGMVGNGITANHIYTSSGSYTIKLVVTSQTGCKDSVSKNIFVKVNNFPAATISGNSIVCLNSSSPTVKFTGTKGTAPYTFTYNINGGTFQTLTSDSTGIANIYVPATIAGTYTYNLLSVKDASTSLCSSSQSGNATIIVNPLPSASISGNVTVCKNATSPAVTFVGKGGKAPYIFTYTVNAGPNGRPNMTNGVTDLTIVSDSNGIATIYVPTATSGIFTYTLLSVQDASASACSQLQSGSVIVTVNPLPTATINGDNSVCKNSMPSLITFSGSGTVPPYTFTYNVNGGNKLNLISDSSGAAALYSPTSSPGTFKYNLVSVVGSDVTACSQSLTGTVVNLNIKNITTSTTNVTICQSALPYRWNGNNYNIAGSYNDTLVNSAGCDSIATLVLNVKAISSSITNISVCPSALPYLWNGLSFNTAGTQTAHLTNSVGCDSAATLTLTVKAISASTTKISVCPSALPYMWNGNSYNTAGSFTKKLVNAVGCDSMATLILTIKAISTSTTNISICPSALPYNWNGLTFNTTGTQTAHLTNSAGCDSAATLTLTIKATSVSTTNISVCPSALPYIWNGLTFNAAGTQTAHLTNSAGCDSAAALILTVKATSASTTSVSICPSSLPYIWNGNNYNTAGSFTKKLVNAVGCDSIATLVLNIKAIAASTTNVSICPSALPYIWNGLTFNSAGTQTAHLTNSIGCDSAATLVLTVKTTSASITNISICPSSLPYIWNGDSYNTTGTFTKKLVNAVGCDSIATLVLNINPTSASTTNISVCPSALPYSWNGNSYNSAGSFTKKLVNAVGCDSIATLILNIKTTSVSTTNISICPSALPYIWNGLTFNSAGIQTAHLTNTVGCDSAATLILTVKATSISITKVSICPSSLPYLWNGNSYNTAGSFTKKLVNAAGCDSIATLVLNIRATSASTTNISVCPSALPYIWNGLTFNSAGTQTAHLNNSIGCDSAATLVLTVKTTSASTTNISICPSSLPYIWNGNSFNTAGSFTRKLVNAVGCDSIATLILNIKPTSASTTNISVCPSVLPYSWNGSSYNTAGTFTKKLVNAVGCDSIATLILNIKTTSVSTTNISICPSALPYIWNGLTFNSAGTQTAHLTNTVGCDSAATLILTVKATSISITKVSICPPSLPYLWNGNSYNTAGSFTKKLVNAVGCDSVATLVLNIKATSASTTNISVCPSALPYNWNGNSYNTAGTFTKKLVNAAGCDSVATLVLKIKATSASTAKVSICPSSTPYLWNGNSYSTAGTYTKKLINSIGCDSIATLVLSIKVASVSNSNVSICPSSLPFIWNGNSYNQAGTFTKKLVNSVGCDSIATLVLNIKATSISNTNVTVCPSSLPYLWNGNSYSTGGTYTKKLFSSAGCDSIATLILSIGKTSVSTTKISICSSSLPYKWNGNNYTVAGTYTKKLINSSGCDSIATLIMSVKMPSASTTKISICPSSLPFAWNGITFSTSATQIVHLTNSAGCDSVATLILDVKTASTSSTKISVCASDLPYKWNGNKYFNAGTYTARLKNTSGCDSIATLILTIQSIEPPSLGNDRNLCPDDTLVLNPGKYEHYLWQDHSTLPEFIVTKTGTYSVTVSNSQGCTSTAKVTIQVLDHCGDIFFPTAFTPNGDGLNDKFGALGHLEGVSNYSLFIFNRWGELVFKTTDPYEKWDGIYKGQILANVDYVWYTKYILNRGSQRMQKGNLMLIK